MLKSQLPKRFTVFLDIEDYEALRKLAEAQCPPPPLQYVVRLAVRRPLDQPKATLFRPAGDEPR